MELALRQVGQNLVISFVGRVNLEGETSIAFKDRLKALITDGSARVIVDLEAGSKRGGERPGFGFAVGAFEDEAAVGGGEGGGDGEAAGPR